MTHIDTQTLTDVINAHGAALVLYARQWCRAPDDAVQEALIELVRQNPTPDDVAAWLHTCVRRRAMNLGRADSRRDNHHRQAGLERESWVSSEVYGGDGVPTNYLIDGDGIIVDAWIGHSEEQATSALRKINLAGL